MISGFLSYLLSNKVRSAHHVKLSRMLLLAISGNVWCSFLNHPGSPRIAP